MAGPVDARAVLFPIYAFNVEVARAPWVSAEPLIGEMRLQWWRDVLEEIAADAPPRAHEVVAPLAGVAKGGRLPLGVLDGLVDAHRVHVDEAGFDTEDALDAFLEATGAGLMWASASALGADPGQEQAVRALGWASGLAAYLRAIPDLEARGRRPLPDGRPEAVRAWANSGLKKVREARHARFGSGIHPALVAGWRTHATLARAVQTPGAVSAGALEESEFRRRGTLLWRALTRTV